jgi:hypothetical protein
VQTATQGDTGSIKLESVPVNQQQGRKAAMQCGTGGGRIKKAERARSGGQAAGWAWCRFVESVRPGHQQDSARTCCTCRHPFGRLHRPCRASAASGTARHLARRTHERRDITGDAVCTRSQAALRGLTSGCGLCCCCVRPSRLYRPSSASGRVAPRISQLVPHRAILY